MSGLSVSMFRLPAAEVVEAPAETVIQTPDADISARWVIPEFDTEEVRWPHNGSATNDDYQAAIDGATFVWPTKLDIDDSFTWKLVEYPPIIWLELDGAEGDVTWELTSYPVEFNGDAGWVIPMNQKALVVFGGTLFGIDYYSVVDGFYGGFPAGTYEITATHDDVEYVFTMILQSHDDLYDIDGAGGY